MGIEEISIPTTNEIEADGFITPPLVCFSSSSDNFPQSLLLLHAEFFTQNFQKTDSVKFNDLGYFF